MAIHPSLAEPAKVVYFIGWITPRPNHHFSAWLRLLDGQPDAFGRLNLDDGAVRASLCRKLERHLKGLDWRELAEAVTLPWRPVAEPLCIEDLPILIVPDAETLKKLSVTTGGGGGGAAA